jgi:hypothetical protein
MEGRPHEEAWAHALAVEHGHQRELLATLRDELGTFARECASALTALDTFAGLAGVAGIVASAATDVKHASLVLEVGRRLGVPGHDRTLEELYGRLGRGEDAPPALVRHASGLLRQKEPRSDRQLLSAVVSSSGAASGIEGLVGPAPWAALAALQPLARWAPQLARIRRGDGDGKVLAAAAGTDLSHVLGAAAQLGAGTGAELTGEAAALADSVRDAVRHVESAAKAVKEGKLEQVLAEMRKTLQADLDRLREVHEAAHEAPAEWREERKAEHAALREEVQTKLERVERIRGVLGLILPHLQAVARTLSAVQKIVALDHRLEPQAAAGVQAASLTVISGLGSLWDAAFAPGPSAAAPAYRARRRVRARHAALAAAAVVAAVLGFVLTKGSSNPSAPPAQAGTTRSTTTPPPTTTAAAGSAWTCDFGTHSGSDRKVLFDNGNVGAVQNGGKPARFDTGGKVYCVGYVQTYHWNNGAGATPGKIILTRAGGPSVAGLPLETTIVVPAKGAPGTNSVQNASWYAYYDPASVFIDGTYSCSDSGGSTWSSNQESKGAGFCRVEVYPAVAAGTTTATAHPKPVLKPIDAVFRPAPAGQSCSPPFCTTTYTEDASGQDLHFRWRLSIPLDRSCAAGFHGSTPSPGAATWYHADESEGGHCNHTRQDYDAAGSGHPGVVTVLVTNAHWRCKARFSGTQGPQAQLSWNGPQPSACRETTR